MDKWVPYVLVGTLGLGLLIILGWVGVQGLGKLSEADPYAGPVAEPAELPRSPILVGRPEVFALDPPPRYRIALPRSLREHRSPGHLYPPPRHVAAWLAVGHPGMRREVLEAATAATAAGARAEELHEMFGELLRTEPSPTHCRWLRDALSSHRLPALDGELWRALVWCTGPADVALFEQPEVPPDALLRWYDAHVVSLRARWDPRIEEAAAQLVRSGAEWVPAVGRVLLALDRERGQRVLTELAESTRDGQVRLAVAELLADPAGGPEDRRDDFDTLLAGAAAPRILAARAGDQQPQLARALVRCATGNTGAWMATECLTTLARLDRTMATQAARAILATDPGPGELREAAVALTEHASSEALLESMRASALLGPTDVPADGGSSAASARELLLESGRAACFDTEAGVAPVGHDAMLQRLAFLASPTLDDVIFEETPPVVDGAGQSFGGYGLHAYMAGHRYTLHGTDYGDWFDVATMVSLLNALLVERGSDVRVAWLVTEDQTTCLVAGTEPALLAAEASGLIALAQPQNAEADPGVEPVDLQQLIESMGAGGGGY